ncbi:MAG TPA: FAD binding domain-containing protein [Thermoanaerobaculia bacterium]|nr:FAD binding domain-containing protein [Thermoanaerobaculia bacterium]
MIRAGSFRYYAASSAADAAAALAGEGADAMLVAGGTDLIPNMKRRQQTPAALVSIRRAGDLHGIARNGELMIGAATSIAEIVRFAGLCESHRALFRAAAQVASPLIRNAATIGGNLCLDTRCNYYDQSLEWRQAIDFCKKAGNGSTCWVAPSSPRCWAVASSDTAPALIALGARVVLRSTAGEREMRLEELYADDGISFLTKERSEILTSIRIPSHGFRSTYWKLRRRGSIDFPVLGAAAALQLSGDGSVEHARIVLGAVASRPLLLAESDLLVGKRLTDDVIEQFAEAASAHAKPLDNADFAIPWRKAAAKTYLTGVLRELRGDDPASFPLLMREAAYGGCHVERDSR